MQAIQTHPDESWAVSVLTIQELFTGKSAAIASAAAYIEQTIAPLNLLPYDYEIAKIAGALQREKRVTTFVDAATAATALKHNAKLFTINNKDFLKIQNLNLLS